MTNETLNAGKEKVEELQKDLAKKLKAEKKRLEEMQEQLSGRSREIWLAGLGLFASAEKEGSKIFNEFVDKGQELVKKGEEVEKRGIEYGSEIRDDVTGKLDETVKFVEDKFYTVMNAFGFTSNSDLKDLHTKVDGLTKAVADLNKKLNAKSATPKKSTK